MLPAVSGRFEEPQIAGSQKSHPFGGYSRGLGNRRIALTAQPDLDSSVRLGQLLYKWLLNRKSAGATLEASLQGRQARVSPSVILLPSRIRTLVDIKI
jgi:hypothetical protein